MPTPDQNIFDSDMPEWARQSFERNFGRTTRNEYFKSPFQRWLPRDEGSSINIEEKKWQINVDVQHFTPEEVTVKINNGFVVVEGKHEEREDEHGFVMRHFSRRFRIPEDTNCNAIESRLSSDGVLSVLAPRMEPPKGEWNIPISYTGPVRTEIKEVVKS